MLEDLGGGSVVASGGKGGETPGAEVSVATARQGELFIAVSAAVALHGVAFAALVLLALAEILIDGSSPKTKPPRWEPESVFVELSPDYFQAPPPRPEPAKAAEAVPAVVAAAPSSDQKAFLQTDESQASETTPEQAVFIGERDTRAASEGPAVADAPPLPTQAGEERLRKELNLFDSSFNDGEEPGDKTAAEAAPEKPAGGPVEGENGEGQPTEPEEIREEEGGQPRDSLLNSDTQVPVPAARGENDEPKEETLPQEKKNQSEAAASKRGEEGTAEKPPEELPKKSGFRTESRKTRIRGSLKRQGRSALDVENTPTGRYRAQVYRVIEREWQKQCINYRNHILPGSLTLRFFVDQRGGVSGLRYIYEFQTSEIQKGFSVMSVRQASLPRMPRAVVKELDGEPMECELDLNFRF